MDRNAADEPQTDNYTLTAPVLDLAATFNGSILVAVAPNTIKEIRQDTVESLATIPVDEGALVSGLAVAGEDGLVIATGGLDLAVGAALWKVSGTGVDRISEIHRYEVLP